MEHPVIDEIAVRVQWVVDKPWCTIRVRTSSGEFSQLPGFGYEWPVDPSTLSDWYDLVREALGHPLAHPTLSIP